MAVMGFREPNQVKWTGTRPGHNGTQVVASAQASGNTQLLYTVPAGNTLYLCSAWISYDGGAAGRGLMYINTPGAVRWLVPASAHITANGSYVYGMTYWPPLEVPAGYLIYSTSAVVGCLLSGNIFGWVE